MNKNANGNEDKFLQHTFITQKQKDVGNEDDEFDEEDVTEKDHLENKEVWAT